MSRFAFFDLDGTLLRHDTQLLFANHVLRNTSPFRRAYLLLFAPFTPFAAVRILRSREMKQLFLSYLFCMPGDQLRELVEDFAKNVVPAVAYPEMLEEVTRHKNEGRTLVLNTASPAFYADAIARELGFDHCIATRVITADPMPLVPQIDGPNNKRTAKLPAMRHLLPKGFDIDNPIPLPDSYAYTDSIVDVPLLSCAEKGFVVNPDSRLSAVAAERGWETLTPPQPFCCKTAARVATAQQLLGLYRAP